MSKTGSQPNRLYGLRPTLIIGDEHDQVSGAPVSAHAFINQPMTPKAKDDWFYVYVESNRAKPVGILHCNISRNTNKKTESYHYADVTYGTGALVYRRFDFEVAELSCIYDSASWLATRNRQQVLKDHFVPPWSKFERLPDSYQIRFRWKVLVARDEDFPDLFDLPTFEPL